MPDHRPAKRRLVRVPKASSSEGFEFRRLRKRSWSDRCLNLAVWSMKAKEFIGRAAVIADRTTRWAAFVRRRPMKSETKAQAWRKGLRSRRPLHDDANWFSSHSDSEYARCKLQKDRWTRDISRADHDLLDGHDQDDPISLYSVVWFSFSNFRTTLKVFSNQKPPHCVVR